MMLAANLHAPEIAGQHLPAIFEHSSEGLIYAIVRVTDADEGQHGEIASLEIINGDPDRNFVIRPGTQPGEYNIQVARTLDREAMPFGYNLTLLATDRGYPPRSGTATVRVAVGDYNDNAPAFVTADGAPTVAVEVSVVEDAAAGAPVYTARALDADAGENGYVSYALADSDSDSDVPFAIDHFTGVLRTTGRLDYEAGRRTYALRVRASDWGRPYRREAEINVTVRVRDVNDHAPRFERTRCSGYVLRSAPPGAAVVAMTAIDFDAGDAVSYAVAGGNDDGLFVIDARTGVVSVNASLEGAPASRALRVVASDGERASAAETVEVAIVRSDPSHALAGGHAAVACDDAGVRAELTATAAASRRANAPAPAAAPLPDRYTINRNAPAFKSDVSSSVSVSEGVAVGAKIMDVSAIDNDLGYNGKLVYAIAAGNDDGCFDVAAETGILEVRAPLDRERAPAYALVVAACDLGSPARCARAEIAVAVMDVNDNAPRFRRRVYAAVIAENVVNGTAITRVAADDADAGKNADVSYSFPDDSPDFSVDARTGEVRVRRPLDRERTPRYELRVRATDGSETNPLAGDSLVVVTLIDVNDNAPRFERAAYAATVREDAPRGAVVTSAVARDPDAGDHGSVRYSLAASLPDAASAADDFAIDAETGTIRVRRALDFERAQIYNLTACAADRGRPPLRACVGVVVEVADVNENYHAPRFDDFALAGSVRESEPAGTVVMVVTATDEDAPHDRSAVVYSLRDGSGLGRFSIDSK
ncbi:PREDICTED: fat-like cadherin-related tumor suppressor homolog, partial [Priapulus caudatus]|uniref:Fat-like cadherin-related tumor suppressor homolog n=1 Tax=Priapulus caudatus TaxID=37621 RepID=A0ABM1EXN5_PRICU